MEAVRAVRLYPFEIALGPANMAADEVLLAAATSGTAALRFYAWTTATVSLGYFQPAEARLRVPKLDQLPFVRRPSGGATLVHHYELTYALALPADWKPPGGSWVCDVHRAIATVLTDLGTEVHQVTCGEEKKLGEVLCFLHQTTGDLTVAGHKVVGSAQRKQRGAVLQHGAILLGRSPRAPQLPGLRELAGVEPPYREFMVSLADSFAEAFAWRFEPAEWTAEQREQVETIAAEKYSSAAWNEKR